MYWTNSGTEVSKDAHFTFTVLANRTLLGNFEKATVVKVISNHYTISVFPNPNDGKFNMKLESAYIGNLHLQGWIQVTNATGFKSNLF